MSGHFDERRSIKLALVGYALLVVLQLVAYLMTKILILYAQALEMLSDVLVSIFLLLSLKMSQKPADKVHMFGHGRAQNVAGLVSAVIFISFMSVEVFREAITELLGPQKSMETQDSTLALVVIGISMLVLAVPIVDILRTKGKGASVKTQLVQLLKDEFSYIPGVIGVILVARGYYQADAVMSVIIGVIILIGGAYLFKDNVNYLLGRSPDREFMARLETTAKSVNGVLGVHNLKAEYVGPNEVHAGLHIEVARGTLVEEAARIAHEVEEAVSIVAGCQHCVIHIDPANAP